MASVVTVGFPEVPIGELARSVDRAERPISGHLYRQIGVRLWGEGAYEREAIDGGETRYGSLSRVAAGDIVVNKIWARNGSVAVVPPGLEGCYVSGEFPTFECLPSRLDPQWFHWITKTHWFWDRCDAEARGTSGKNRIRPERFLTIPIPLPPLAEQQRIVARIEMLSRKVKTVVPLRMAARTQLDAILPSELNRLFGSPYESRPGDLSEATFVPLADLTDDIADGPHKTPTYVEKGVPFITVLNITSGRIRFTSLNHVSQEDFQQLCRRAQAEKGDVLLSKDGTIGVPCFVDTDRHFAFFVSVALIKPRRGVLDGEFLTWVLRAPYLVDRMVGRSRGDMIRHLVLREIAQLLVPVLSLAEQRRIVSYLDGLQAKVDTLKSLQARTAAELEALLPSILDRAFRGEI